MRFFKLKQKINWKYIIGEILLIFIGINLAIWFNDWNTSKKTTHDKTVVIAKIKDEIVNNTKELDFARTNNQRIASAFSEYKKYFDGISSKVLATPEQKIRLQKEYPNFFRVKDSTATDDGKYIYNGGTFIQLEIPDLTGIAWETAKSTTIANEFEYDCLYNFESMYSLQNRVQTEINKAANALQERKLDDLMNILEFLSQLDTQLLKTYSDVLEGLDECR